MLDHRPTRLRPVLRSSSHVKSLTGAASDTISLQEAPQAFAAAVVEVVSGVSRSTSNIQCGHTNFLGH